MSFIDDQGRNVREELPLEGMRETITNMLLDSKRNYPQGTGNAWFDVTNLVEFRKDLNKKLEAEGKKVSFGDLYTKVCACAVEENMQLNGSRQGDKLIFYNDINLSISASINGILVTPVLEHADRKDIVEISDELKKIYGWLRKGKMARVKWDGATFSMNNMGGFTIDGQMPFINPPQAAHFSVGRNNVMPVYNDKLEIVPGNMTSFYLTIDHGFADGVDVASFLASVEKVIKDPETYLFHKAEPRE